MYDVLQTVKEGTKSCRPSRPEAQVLNK